MQRPNFEINSNAVYNPFIPALTNDDVALANSTAAFPGALPLNKIFQHVIDNIHALHLGAEGSSLKMEIAEFDFWIDAQSWFDGSALAVRLGDLGIVHLSFCSINWVGGWEAIAQVPHGFLPQQRITLDVRGVDHSWEAVEFILYEDGTIITKSPLLNDFYYSAIFVYKLDPAQSEEVYL